MVFHVLNRGAARMQLFERAGDFQAFERVLQETRDETPMRICAYALMPNHWHLLLWPQRDGDLATFMQRLSITHVRRWQEHRDAEISLILRNRGGKSFPKCRINVHGNVDSIAQSSPVNDIESAFNGDALRCVSGGVATVAEPDRRGARVWFDNDSRAARIDRNDS